MRFNEHVAVRDEGDHFLLQQARNGAIVTLTHKVFSAVAAAERGEVSDPATKPIIERLDEMGFLDTYKPEASPSDAADCGRRERGEKHFFKLRSRVAPLNVLWETTSKCNLTCVYCFPDVKSRRKVQQDLPPEKMQLICDELIKAKVLKVTLSGGEALLRGDIWDIVAKLESNAVMTFAISNGTHLSDGLIEKIKRTNLMLAVSLDGHDEATNRITRGAGAFQKTVDGIQRLRRHGVKFAVLGTVTRHNFPTLADTVRLLRGHGVRFITLQDLRPFGTREIYDSTRLTREQEAALAGTVARLEADFPDITFNLSELFIFGAQTSATYCTGKLMDCVAGDHSAYLDGQGNLFPCTTFRFMPVGNVLESGLTELWQRSEKLIEFRRMKDMPKEALEGCRACPKEQSCHRGCRADALFHSGSLMGLASRCHKQLAMV